MPATKTKAKPNVWTDEERAAMQESARERKSKGKLQPRGGAGRGRGRGPGEIRRDAGHRARHGRAHPRDSCPGRAGVSCQGRTTGCPAYTRAGKTICFFQPALKFRVRYSTFGFQPDARIDDGVMWPVAYAMTELTPAVETRIAELVKKASA